MEIDFQKTDHKDFPEELICEECGESVLTIATHLPKCAVAKGLTIEGYQEKHGADKPLINRLVYTQLKERKLKRQKEAEAQRAKDQSETSKSKPQSAVEFKPSTNDAVLIMPIKSKQPLHEVFNLGDEGKQNATKKPIPIEVLDFSESEYSKSLVPKVNDTYVYESDVLKSTLLGLHLNYPVYVWGHKGCGKSEMFEQICARTGRPLVRIQHTANTEESNIVGMWTVKNSEMQFELGPLPLAMKYGWTFMADEYDFASPAVLAVYQAVLEGKPLYIKEADEQNRVIEPHPDFRFVATGNTNGTGDDTVLYQGTTLQNSANYDRFGVVIRKNYLPQDAEIKLLVNHVNIEEKDALTFVQFANKVRDAFDKNEITDTISPRSIIRGAKLGICLGSMSAGIKLAFLNKLNATDEAIVKEIADRHFAI